MIKDFSSRFSFSNALFGLKFFSILFLFSFPLYAQEVQTPQNPQVLDKKAEMNSTQKNPTIEESPAPAPQAEPLKEVQKESPTPTEAQTKESPPQTAIVEKESSSPSDGAGEKTAPNSSKEEPASFLASLKDLVSFYEQEIVSFNKLIERWNSRVHSILEREVTLKIEIEKINKEIFEKKEADEKKNKKEIGRLEKQVKRLKKDLKSVQKTLDNERDELLSELKDLGKESQNAVKEKYKSVSEKVETFGQAEQEE